MSTVIIISAHGKLSEQLLRTSEMIIGKQDKVFWVNFFPGENTKNLEEKYIYYLSQLDKKDEVLFLVDTWGGTPFNAANSLSIGKKNYEVISGVNVPMLTEILMSREENSLKSLTSIALEVGRMSIRSTKFFKEKNSNNYLSQSSFKEEEKLKKEDIIIDNNKCMKICLVRIDDRLIHGQVVTCWAKTIKVDRIIVVNDQISTDNVRKSLLIQVSPPGITAHVISVQKAIRVYNNPKYSNDRVMLLFTNPTDVLQLIKYGLKINSVNVGGMAFTPGRYKISDAVSIDKKDIESFIQIGEYGIKIEIRKVPTDSPINILKLIRKMKIDH